MEGVCLFTKLGSTCQANLSVQMLGLTIDAPLAMVVRYRYIYAECMTREYIRSGIHHVLRSYLGPLQRKVRLHSLTLKPLIKAGQISVNMVCC
jgi:hypothetical protein